MAGNVARIFAAKNSDQTIATQRPKISRESCPIEVWVDNKNFFLRTKDDFFEIAQEVVLPLRTIYLPYVFMAIKL
ncbi:MAG TPA: hypothetical protein DCX34_08300 [Roseovarius sp.]|nr:hypothetical protein [Roseovarius sp.]